MSTAKRKSDTRTFGQLIAAARTAAGPRMTQEVVAQQLTGATHRSGLSTSFFSDIERDHRNLDVGYWEKLVKVLPTLSIAALAAAEVRTRQVRVDARFLSLEAQRSLAKVLTAAAKGGRT